MTQNCDCGEPHGHKHNCALFTCFVCGGPTLCAPDEGPAYCPEHCPDHDYKYEPCDGKRCVICSAEPPYDYWD